MRRCVEGALTVEEVEGLHDLLSGVLLGHLGRHHHHELVEVDGAVAVLVDVGDHLADLVLLWLEPESTHGNLKLLGIDGA